MAKAVSLKIKLVSTADTGFYYVTKKNSRTQTEKLSFKKYDPVVRKHVEFKEAKIKYSAASAPIANPRAHGAGFFVTGVTNAKRPPRYTGRAFRESGWSAAADYL